MGDAGVNGGQLTPVRGAAQMMRAVIADVEKQRIEQAEKIARVRRAGVFVGVCVLQIICRQQEKQSGQLRDHNQDQSLEWIEHKRHNEYRGKQQVLRTDPAPNGWRAQTNRAQACAYVWPQGDRAIQRVTNKANEAVVITNTPSPCPILLAITIAMVVTIMAHVEDKTWVPQKQREPAIS